MGANYLAVVSCLRCGEMIITKPDGSIFCACTTKRLCKHPERMNDCHKCRIATLEGQLTEAQGKLDVMQEHVMALRPFAVFAVHIDPASPDDAELLPDLAIAHFRNAKVSYDTAARILKEGE